MGTYAGEYRAGAAPASPRTGSFLYVVGAVMMTRWSCNHSWREIFLVGGIGIVVFLAFFRFAKHSHDSAKTYQSCTVGTGPRPSREFCPVDLDKTLRCSIPENAQRVRMSQRHEPTENIWVYVKSTPEEVVRMMMEISESKWSKSFSASELPVPDEIPHWWAPPTSNVVVQVLSTSTDQTVWVASELSGELYFAKVRIAPAVGADLETRIGQEEHTTNTTVKSDLPATKTE